MNRLLVILYVACARILVTTSAKVTKFKLVPLNMIPLTCILHLFLKYLNKFLLVVVQLRIAGGVEFDWG
jgi:hypothetical protein